jgi:hypothetical protein
MTAVDVIDLYTTLEELGEVVRPFDWLMLIIETLVLLLIAYEVIIGSLHRREDSKRQDALHDRIMALARLMDRGQKLKRTAPQVGVDGVPWVKSVHEWGRDTEAFLDTCSAHASSKFLDETNMQSVSYPQLAQEVWVWYSLLDRKLSNLQTIIQNSTVYLSRN